MALINFREKTTADLSTKHTQKPVHQPKKEYQLIRLDKQSTKKSLTSGLLLIFIFHRIKNISKFNAAAKKVKRNNTWNQKTIDVKCFLFLFWDYAREKQEVVDNKTREMKVEMSQGCLGKVFFYFIWSFGITKL